MRAPAASRDRSRRREAADQTILRSRRRQTADKLACPRTQAIHHELLCMLSPAPWVGIDYPPASAGGYEKW